MKGLAAAVAAHAKALAALRDTERKRDDAIRAAAREGMSARAIARATGLSHQRVSQVLRGTR